MADSSDDLRRQMEEFERNEDDPQAGTAALEAPAPARKMIPAWVYAMIAFDILIFVVVLFVFVL